MKQYFISKEKYNGEIVYLNLEKLKGYKINPKNNYNYDGIKVNEMIIIKPSLIEKVIKRKIKSKLDYYLKMIIDNLDGNDSDDDTRIALDDLQRYKKIINDKYSIYLDEKYMALLNKKINVFERELKNNILYQNLIDDEKTVEEDTRKKR